MRFIHCLQGFFVIFSSTKADTSKPVVLMGYCEQYSAGVPEIVFKVGM